MSEMSVEEVYEVFPNAVRVIHTVCGGIAFWYSELPVGKRIILDPRKAMTVDGRKVREGDPVICSRCDNPVGREHMEFCIEEGRLH